MNRWAFLSRPAKRDSRVAVAWPFRHKGLGRVSLVRAPLLGANLGAVRLCGFDDGNALEPSPQGGTIVARHVSAGEACKNILESRRDGTMAHTYTSILYHLVFCTKDR